jgi:nuclear pore complex protein Nup214
LATNIRQFAWFEGGGGFGSFGGNQGAGFSAFGASGGGRPAADFLTQMRK